MTDSANPLPSLLQMMVAAVARHLITGIAGALAVACGLTTDQTTQFETGGVAVIVFLAGVGWSMMQKKAVAEAVVPQPLPADLPPT